MVHQAWIRAWCDYLWLSLCYIITSLHHLAAHTLIFNLTIIESGWCTRELKKLFDFNLKYQVLSSFEDKWAYLLSQTPGAVWSLEIAAYPYLKRDTHNRTTPGTKRSSSKMFLKLMFKQQWRSTTTGMTHQQPIDTMNSTGLRQFKYAGWWQHTDVKGYLHKLKSVYRSSKKSFVAPNESCI